MFARRKSLILAAVILALIMVVPASYFISADLNGHKPLPAISTSNSETTQSWVFNFNRVNNTDYQKGYNSNNKSLPRETASFQQSGYNTSFLYLSGYIEEFPYFGIPLYNNDRVPLFYFTFNVSGSVMASALPTGILASYNTILSTEPYSGLPSYTATNGNYVGMWNITMVNVSSGYASWNGTSHVIQLVNQSNFNGKDPYRFTYFDSVEVAVYAIGPNQPFIFNFNFTLLGLSRPVYNDMALQLMDINSTTGSTGFVVADSHPYDSTQNSGGLMNLQSPLTKMTTDNSLLRSFSSFSSTTSLVTGNIILDSGSASIRSYALPSASNSPR